MSKTIEFSDDDYNKIANIIKFYFLSKELLIFGEQIDPLNKTLPQPINELRNCLEHLMRVGNVKFKLKEQNDDSEYISKNLNKAYGHVYRAAYDALDWISLTIRGFVSDELIKYSNEAIKSAIPDYYTKLRPQLEKILTKEITELRKSKDVALGNEELFRTHIKIIADLKEIREKIIIATPALIDYENRKKKSKRKDILIKVFTSLGVSIISGFLVWIITYNIMN